MNFIANKKQAEIIKESLILKVKKIDFLSNSILLLIAVLLGTTYSFYLMGNIIFPTETDWLFNTLDTSTYQIGWLYFRYDTWHWPLTFTDDLAYPTGASISYTDSIPILAIIFKLFSSWLPHNFQYFGIYLCFNFIMQFFWGAKIAALFFRRNYFFIIGTGIIFMIAPPLSHRILHIALTSHWLILASIWTYFSAKLNQYSNLQFIFLLQALIIFFASGVNPYIAVMSLSFILITYLDQILQKKINVIKGLIISLIFICLLGLGWYLFGYLSSNSSVGNIYGVYSLNPITLFNSVPFTSSLRYLLKDSPVSSQISTYQYEGFNYLGVGILILLLTNFLALTTIKRNFIQLILKTLKDYKILFILLIFLTIFALSNKIYWLDNLVVEYPLPESIEKLFGSFRCSGRFFWPVHYLILLTALILTIQLWSRNQVKIILTLIIAIQFLDLIPLQLAVNHSIDHKVYTDVEFSPEWKQLAQNHTKLIVFPSYQSSYHCGEPLAQFPTLEKLAALQGLKTNSAYLARYSPSQMQTHCVELPETIANGKLEPDAAYVLEQKKFYKAYTKINNDSQNSHYCTTVDNLILCRKRLSSQDKGLISLKADPYSLGSQLDFTNSEQISKYLFGDWSNIDSGGTWTDGNEASLIMDINEDFDKDNLMLNVEVSPFIFGDHHPNQVVDIWINGQKLTQWIFQDTHSQFVTKKALIPANLLAQKSPLEITFKMLNPVSPKSVGLNEDRRQLGLLFKTVQLSTF